MSEANLARQLHQAGRLQAAESHYLNAMRARPGNVVLVLDYALLLMQSGRASEALTLLDSNPVDIANHPQAMLVQAQCHRILGQIGPGILAAEHSTRLLPQHPLAWLLLGSLQQMSGNYVKADTSLRRALGFDPSLAEAWHYLGESLQARGRYAEAVQAYSQAARVQPTEAINIGICTEMQGDLEQARSWYLKMDQLAPDRLDNLIRLAHVCAQLCRMEECDAVTARIEAIDVQSEGHAIGSGMEPFPLTYLPLTESFKRRALAAHAEHVAAKAAALVRSAHAPNSYPDRLRLGYVSPDLGAHAVGRLLQQHFGAHDRKRFEVTVYSLRNFNDEVANEIAGGVEHFKDVSGLTDIEVAQAIHADGIDVLIDLGGYTHGARPAALAMRPAFVQLGWLGFAHAQEAPWLDGIILDAWTAPESERWPYHDCVYRMDSPFLPAWQQETLPSNRERFGLPPSSVPLLASFNNSYKLDQSLLAAWSRILGGAPRAHMVVFLRELQARPGFLATWRAVGGDAARLVFAEPLPFNEQLARAASCDLFLDAFRYQSGATGIMSVGAGLPVLSISGHHPPSRMSAAINRYIGMDELVADDILAYVDTATKLANCPDLLAAMRKRFSARINSTDLFSPRRAAAEIERISMEAIRKLA